MTALPPVSVASAHTVDSKSVTITYDVNSPNLGPTLNFGIYRSADATFDAGDEPVTSLAIPASALGQSTLDDGGAPASAVGHHTLTIVVPGGLTIEPDRPYVLAVANPATAIGSPDLAARTGVIHTHSIAVVTHGGIQSKSSDGVGPIWQREMARAVAAQGYDSVVKYVWSKDSRIPGRAEQQGATLDRIINRIAADYPAGDPVDVHFIGHSEGTVVNSRAAQLLQLKEDPGIAIGYMQMTLLDPHAANKPYARLPIQRRGGHGGPGSPRTPFASSNGRRPTRSSACRRTSIRRRCSTSTRGLASPTRIAGCYNLWGQVPVHGNATYYDVTGPGISHGGDFSVPMWYTANIVPTLHGGDHFIDPSHVTGSRVLAASDVTTRWYSTSSTSQPEFSGTAAPNATMTLFAARNTSFGWKNVGQGTADASGHWDLAPRPLHNGRYRFVIRAGTEAFPNHPNVQVTPRLRLGSVTIRAPRVRPGV